MRTTAEFIDTDTVDLTIAITMSLRDWKALRAAIKDVTAWPTSDLKYAITEAVTRAEGRIAVPSKSTEA